MYEVKKSKRKKCIGRLLSTRSGSEKEKKS